MDNQDKFWLIIWSLVAVCFITMVLSVMRYNMTEAKLIANSPDPIATACALQDNRTSSTCIAYVGARK